VWSDLFKESEFLPDKKSARVIILCMRASEILDALPSLTKVDREEIRLKLAELDGDGWVDADDPLSDADKALIEARVEAHERDPSTSIPWEKFEQGLKRRLGE
jgi:putative addiction module component (TIGR02574 family)